jgi:hypothetical protein
MTDDEILARLLRRILTSDGYDAPCVVLDETGLLIDGWTDVNQDEIDAITRAMNPPTKDTP